MSSGFDAGDEEIAGSLTSLVDDRRRHMLAILNGTDVPLSLADLAFEIARRELADDDIDLAHEQVEQIYVQLYHRDVPKLADAGLVEFETATNTVSLTDVTVSIDEVLHLLSD